MKLDGRSIAKVILTEIKNDTLQLKHSGITPHLVVIFIGNDAGSKAYIKQKMKKRGGSRNKSESKAISNSHFDTNSYILCRKA